MTYIYFLCLHVASISPFIAAPTLVDIQLQSHCDSDVGEDPDYVVRGTVATYDDIMPAAQRRDVSHLGIPLETAVQISCDESAPAKKLAQ